ncbi:MAG: biotin transporter BioY [Gemmatimonadales bacterium]
MRAQFIWPLALAAGVGGVAIAAQAALVLPFTPVPVSLQGLAVLLTGGLFGASVGAGAMVIYLALGAFGLPVFASGSSGLNHLFGPTGGYLLAFPVAAFVTGRVAERGRLARCLLGAALGMALLHLVGLTWLAIVTGRPVASSLAGLGPVALSDLAKVLVATLVLWKFAGTLRPRA